MLGHPGGDEEGCFQDCSMIGVCETTSSGKSCNAKQEERGKCWRVDLRYVGYGFYGEKRKTPEVMLRDRCEPCREVRVGATRGEEGTFNDPNLSST
jgi:hypothetical protein